MSSSSELYFQNSFPWDAQNYAPWVTPENRTAIVYQLLETTFNRVMVAVGFDTPDQCIEWIGDHSDFLDFSDPDLCWESLPTEEFASQLYSLLEKRGQSIADIVWC